MTIRILVHKSGPRTGNNVTYVALLPTDGDWIVWVWKKNYFRCVYFALASKKKTNVCDKNKDQKIFVNIAAQFAEDKFAISLPFLLCSHQN